jgi:hypothetical protein
MLLPAVPAVSLTPSSLSFGDQLAGTTSAPQTITLVNTGSSTLTVYDGQLYSNADRAGRQLYRQREVQANNVWSAQRRLDHHR